MAKPKRWDRFEWKPGDVHVTLPKQKRRKATPPPADRKPPRP